MSMGYSYSPYSKDEQVRSFFGKRGKQIIFAVIIIFLVSVFYVTGSALTSYATYNSNLEKQLNSTKNALADSQQKTDTCILSLENANKELKTCNDNTIAINSDLSVCKTNINNLELEIKTYSTAYDACRAEKDAAFESFKQLARSSVKAICCSYGDVQTGNVRNWDIINNSVVCSGNYTVNCNSGETNY